MNGINFPFKKPKYRLTEFIIVGYFSFYKLIYLNEARTHSPKSFKGKSETKFDYKVTFMNKEIDDIISEIDNLVKSFPELINDYPFTIQTTSVKFVQSLDKFIVWVKTVSDEAKEELNRRSTNKILTIGNIDKFKKINSGIIAFNLFLDKVDNIFLNPMDSGSNNIIFDKNDSLYNTLMATLSSKIDLLEIPEKPILDESNSETKAEELI